MAIFVLVHGAWGGAHSFRHVRRALRADGHEVFTPGLTGIGERVHLASAQVNLTTHVQDVVHAVLYEDLRDIVLLGFSYGGFVVTGALEHIGDRVRHLVYVDAFVPADGDTLQGLSGWQLDDLMGIGPQWLLPPAPRQFEDPAEGAWANPRRVPHPIACFTEAVRVRRPLEEQPFSRTYVLATGEPRRGGVAAFWAAGDKAKESAAWRYHEISSNHMIPNNRPKELARILLNLA